MYRERSALLAVVVGLLAFAVVASSATNVPLTPAHWRVLYDGFGQAPPTSSYLFIYL
jgi:hypothetical protein